MFNWTLHSRFVRSLLVMLVAALLVGVAIPAAGAEKAGKKKGGKQKLVVGVLARLDGAGQALVIETTSKDGKEQEQSLKFAAAGKVQINGNDAALGDLKVGMTLTCTLVDGEATLIRAYPPVK